MKNFDKWNKKKKIINNRRNLPRIKPREIWWCNLGINVGNEQDGDSNNFIRPILILKVYNKDLLIGIPATTNQKTSKFYFPIQIKNKTGALILSQYRPISTKRLIKRVTKIKIEKEIFKEIKNSIKNLL